MDYENEIIEYYGVYGIFTDEEESELRLLLNDPKPDNESKA